MNEAGRVKKPFHLVTPTQLILLTVQFSDISIQILNLKKPKNIVNIGRFFSISVKLADLVFKFIY